MLLEDDELLPIIIEYMQSDNVNLMNEACWTISNMINRGFDDIIKRVIQADHCINNYVNALTMVDVKTLGNRMITALTKCIEVESGLKEMYMNKNLKEILEKNDFIKVYSTDSRILLLKFVDGFELNELNSEFIEKRRKIGDNSEKDDDEY